MSSEMFLKTQNSKLNIGIVLDALVLSSTAVKLLSKMIRSAVIEAVEVMCVCIDTLFNNSGVDVPKVYTIVIAPPAGQMIVLT